MEHSKPRTLSIWIAVLSIVVAAVSFFIPVVHSIADEGATHWRTAITTLIAALYLGTATSLLDGLKSFKRDLRVAYRLLAIGIIAFSAVFIQLVFWAVLNMWDSAWATSGSGLVPFIITCAFIYTGVRKFAGLVGVKSIISSYWFVTGITLAVAALTYVLALQFVQYELDGVEIYVTVCAICASFLFFAGLVTYKIYQAIGPYYKVAMGWLATAIFGLSVAAAHESINTFWFNNGDAYDDFGFYLIPWVVVGFLLVRASYEFRLLPAVAGGQGGEGGEASEVSSRDYIDSILNIVALVSKPKEIDPALDGLRVITANLDSAKPLSNAEKQRLMDTYYKVENYLMKDDALRTFTKEEIRSRTTPSFQILLTKG
ncbi:MAG TPA: hypothetical protein VLI54_06380 [Bacillota bacterium]|nr:hypothetical protein [Bacillota bacterium]